MHSRGCIAVARGQNPDILVLGTRIKGISGLCMQILTIYDRDSQYVPTAFDLNRRKTPSENSMLVESVPRYTTLPYTHVLNTCPKISQLALASARINFWSRPCTDGLHGATFTGPPPAFKRYFENRNRHFCLLEKGHGGEAWQRENQVRTNETEFQTVNGCFNLTFSILFTNACDINLVDGTGRLAKTL